MSLKLNKDKSPNSDQLERISIDEESKYLNQVEIIPEIPDDTDEM